MRRREASRRRDRRGEYPWSTQLARWTYRSPTRALLSRTTLAAALPRSPRPVDGLDEGICGRDDPIVLVREAVSARDRFVALLDERIVGGDDSVVTLTERQKLARKAGLRTGERRRSGLAHLGLDRVELGLRIVALPLQRLEGLIEALQLGGDSRESLLIDVDLGL